MGFWNWGCGFEQEPCNSFLTLKPIEGVDDVFENIKNNSKIGFDYQNTSYYFLKDILKNTSDLVIEPGDVINWDDMYRNNADTPIDNRTQITNAEVFARIKHMIC